MNSEGTLILTRHDIAALMTFSDYVSAVGEVHHGIQHGLISRADVYAELGELISGRKAGRRSPDEITILDTTGTALQDVAVAAAIYERARHAGIGYVCDLAR
jgi:ornithine cyclodeaminase/alanine dehydrogenase-like protein (mu-crystallin family)